MKQALFLICVLIFCLSALSAEMVRVSGGNNSVQVISSSASETILQFNISQFSQEKVVIDGSDWYHINLPQEGVTQDKGFPRLPVFNRSIVIDDRARMQLEVYDVRYQDIALKVAPSKGIITRDIDPATVPYTFDKVYLGKNFYPNELAELSEPYILRDFRGITVRTVPFAYNPETQTLRIYTSYKVRVYQDGTDVRNVFNNQRTSISREFMPIYENHFLNWNTYRYTPVSDAFGKLLVICHTNYMSTILPYVNWKKQKGIETELIEWSTIGTTATQLQTYIQNRYNADNTIAYVQLVGDAPQIPSLSSGGGGSDPSFSLVAGGDNYPDIFIGRFSAETTDQVTAQINKAIVYERDLTTTATWLNSAMGIASAEGGGTLGDNGESDIAHMNLIRNDLLGYGYTTVDQVYDPGASAATVTANVNAGRGFINYVGHGADTYWVTTGFSNTNATALTNGNKTPFIMDVACVNGNFVSITCFAEAWLRNANGGAVAMYASTINQSWNSPMRAQDECTDLLIAESKTTTGGLYYNSSCKMMDIYGNTTGSDGVNMFKTWHIFGDASLVVRSKTPLAMTVTHPSTIVIGTTSVNVSTGVANALVAITYSNTIYGRGFTDGSGNATITLTNPPSSVLTYTITATAFNRVTYVGSIQQIAGTGPFMTVSAATYADSNNNTPEYNETGRFNVTFNNIGASSATNVTAVLTCSTPGITITDNTETISSLAAGANTTISNAYYFNIANNVANGTSANFTITMTMSGQDPWMHNFSLTLNAPALAFGNMTISDPSPGNNNGLLDPGETVTLTMPLSNTGAAASPSGNATLTSPTPGITVSSGTANFSAISVSGTTNLVFSVSANAGMAEGTLASLVFNAVAGAYTANKTENVEVGAPLELTIGNGTSSQTYPIDRYYNYSSHEAIYLASEIGMAGNIKSIGFYKASGTDVNTIDAVTIYMKNTTASTLATGTYSTTGYTLVYSGTFPNTATSGWMEVDLDTMFEHDGVSNLSILTIKGYQAWISAYPYWRYTVTTTRARQARSDDAQPTSLTATTYLPNLKLKIFPSGDVVFPPQNLTAIPGNGYVNLNWQAPVSGTPTGYKVYRNSSLLTSVTGLTHTDNTVVNETTYSYYVTALYGTEESDPSNTAQATPTGIPVSSVVIGSGTASTTSYDACPINVWYESLHGQSVYTAAELNAAGLVGPATITEIGFNVTGLPTLAMPNYLIRMGHTTAANAASWISTGLSTVWTSTSYLPATTGWNMFTLATPFAWNGTDNIVIDTAFGVMSSYTATGFVQYTSVTNGYRYVRLDDVDQTSVFTGGSTSTYRPNVKLTLQAQQSGPAIAVNPSSLAFGNVAVNTTANLQFTIQNTGDQTMTGSITTPAGYTVALSAREAEPIREAADRNVLAFSINSSQSKSYTLTFAPTAVQAYNGNVAISSNAVNNAAYNLAVTGSGYIPQGEFPVGPRFVAEWEPAKGAIVRYPLGLPYALLANISASDLLYVVVSTANQSACNTALSGNGVNMANVRYINAATDTYWTRDYGPWTIFESDNSMKIVDFTYNRPRPNDDVIPTVVADYLGIGHYDMPITHTGGNIMTDGMGKAMSTELVLEENTSLTQSQINTMFSNYLGVTEYQLYEDPNNTYIDHIDCWAKILDVDKVMIRSVPTSHAQYSAIEAAVADWQTKTSSYGTPYRIYRVYTPNDEPYSNAYILNKKIYVPQMGTANDAAALTAYQNAMPGYTVLGYSYSNFEGTDAIHCRANTVFDEQMVALQHIPPTSVIADHTVTLTVQITHTNALNPAQTYVAWKHTPVADWQYAPLTLSAREVWTASVPTPGYGETLYYWIKGTDTAGKNTTLPLCAGSDPFTLVTNVIIDLDAPVVTISRTGSGTLLEWEAVANADEYQIYRSLTPYGSYSLLSATSALEYTDAEVLPMAFYYVKAVTNRATRN